MLTMHPEVQKMMGDTFRFALEKPERFTSFIQRLAYLENWGRKDGYPDPKVEVHPDHEKHSFLFNINTCDSYDKDGELEYKRAIMICLYYREESDKWETHS